MFCSKQYDICIGVRKFMSLCFPWGWNRPLWHSRTISRWFSFWLVAALRKKVWESACRHHQLSVPGPLVGPWCRCVGQWECIPMPEGPCSCSCLPHSSIPTCRAAVEHRRLVVWAASAPLPGSPRVSLQVMLEGGLPVWNFDWDEAGVGVSARGYVYFLCSFLLSSVRPRGPQSSECEQGERLKERWR